VPTVFDSQGGTSLQLIIFWIKDWVTRLRG